MGAYTNLEVKPFTIAIPEAEIGDLKDRLARTRWADAIPGSDWTHGIDLAWTKELAAYWRDGFDWREQEAMLNAFPQFTATIDGQTVHFIHLRSPEPDALPLILTHGWPSTFADFAAMIGPLTDPRRHGSDPADAFDVVVPSIPGFGFSGPTQEPGWDSARIARAWDTLMHGLGYTHYVAHGGDAGSFITRQMGSHSPTGCWASTSSRSGPSRPGHRASWTASPMPRRNASRSWRRITTSPAPSASTRPGH